MIDLNKYFYLWKRVLTKPEQTFKAEIKKSSPEGFTKNLAVAGLITGFIVGIVTALGFSGTLFGALGSITAFVLVLVAMPLLFIFGALINSAVVYVFSWLLGGKGNFTNQSYLISLYAAPINIIVYVLMFIPLVNILAIIVLGIYSLYLLTLALKQVHSFNTGKAILVWLLPIVISLLFMMVMIMMVAYLPTMFQQFNQSLTV